MFWTITAALTMHFNSAPAVVFLATIYLIIFNAHFSARINADALGIREEDDDLEAICRENSKFDKLILERSLETISARILNQVSTPRCRNYSTSVGLSSTVPADEHQLCTRDACNEDEPILWKRSNEGLARRMIPDTSPMQDLSNTNSKEIKSKADTWKNRVRNFRQTSLLYKQAVELAKHSGLPEEYVTASYLEAIKKQEQIFAEEVKSLTRIGRHTDAAVYEQATSMYLTTMRAYRDMIFVDARRGGSKRPSSPTSVSKQSFTGPLHRRRSKTERLIRRVLISREIERRAKHLEYIAQNFKQFSGSYEVAVDWARSRKWPEPKIKAAYFAARALRERELAQEVENLRLTGRGPDAARLREAVDAYIDAWQRNWATVLADASEGKETHTTSGESSKSASGGMLRRTLGAHQLVRRVWTPEEVERRAADLEYKAQHFRTATYVYVRLVAIATSKSLRESSVREVFAAARETQQKIFNSEIGNLENAGRTQDARRYRRATDAFMAVFDRNVEFLSSDAGKSVKDPTAGGFDDALQGKFQYRAKNGRSGKHEDRVTRRDAKIERRARDLWDSAEVERRAKELEAMASNFKESKLYKRAVEIARAGELNEVKMKQVYFGARTASAERYNRIVLDLRWAWRTRDADRYRKAADKLLEVWDRSYFSFLADVRRLSGETTKDEGTSKSEGQGPRKGHGSRSGFKKGFLL